MESMWLISIKLLLFWQVLSTVTSDSKSRDENISSLVSSLLSENADLKERLSLLENAVGKLQSMVSYWSGDKKKEKRLLLSSSRETVPLDTLEYPAFYALLTHQETNISPHHTLVFDFVKTDTHEAYSNVTGAYTVPVSGMYVISWSVRSYGGHSFELVCNGHVLDSGYSGGNIQQMTGKTYLGPLEANDVIFVRTHDSYIGDGYIFSNGHGFSNFLGYRIMQ